MKKVLYGIWETAEVVIVAVLAVIIIRTFLVQPFLVSGASMEPNFTSGDYLLVDELTYRFREPERGEVIVFRYPGNPNTYYIKRIIGLPKEELVFNRNHIIVRNEENPNGTPLTEAYLENEKNEFEPGRLTLEEGQYFVLGDNRQYSFDSRSWGTLPEENIIGIARLRLWPFTKVMAVEQPTY